MKQKKWPFVYVGLVTAVTYIPILLTVVYSFNESKISSVWGGFSLKWYGELFRDRDLREAFRRVRRWLKPGGLFLFDVNTPYKLRRMDGQVYMDETEEAVCVWRTFFSEKKQACTYQVDLFRLRPDGTWDRSFEEHRERAWSEEEIRRFLEEAGFSSVRLTGDLTDKPPGLNEDRWQFQCS